MASLLSPLIFFGSDEFSLASLKALHEAGWPIKAVVTKPDSPAGRGRQLAAPPAKVWAEEHRIPVLQPDKVGDAEPKLNNFGVQLGVVASYGKLIPDKILNLFPLGLINVHPSLLPKYRGPAPIEAAILNGDTESGVSIMRLVSEMDAGPVYAQEILRLNGSETQPELYQVLGQLGGSLLVKNLPGIASGNLEPKDQDEAAVSTTSLIQKADGQIDWKLPAERIERQIRAYLNWPGSRTSLFGKEIMITKAYALPEQSLDVQPGEAVKEAGIITVATGSGSLCIERVKPAGSREMSAAEFLAGLR